MKDNIIESLERMRRYLKKMKPTDDYVRGYKDAKSMIDETLKETIKYITGGNMNNYYKYDELYDTVVKTREQMTDLESALNTARFFIFISGICGFILGLSVVFLIV